MVEMLKLRDSAFLINADIWSNFTETYTNENAIYLGKIKVFINKFLWDAQRKGIVEV